MKEVKDMNREELKVAIDRFWNLPKVEHGKAQVPYLYSEDSQKFLNDAMDRNIELRQSEKLVHAVMVADSKTAHLSVSRLIRSVARWISALGSFPRVGR